MVDNIKIYVSILVTLLASCSEDIPVINQSSKYAECNAALEACAGSPPGEYCLFGYKWGDQKSFTETGPGAQGPKASGGRITFSFQGKNGNVNTHRQINVPSESWDEILPCAQLAIRAAIFQWQEVADITFEELPANSESDIRFFAAGILQSAVGFPNYSEAPCNLLSGDVIFDANSKEKSCIGFYINALHEVGHVLGLGHVDSNNIMAAGQSKFSLNGLQPGDIEGVQQIYGE